MRVACLAACLCAVACDSASEAAFVAGRSEDACLEAIPACPGLYGSCVLTDSRYARAVFPGAFSFVVETDPEAEIDVLMYFSEQSDVGLETKIFWNEPGCSDVQVYDSAGENLFEEAKDVGYISRKKRVFEGGEHLIEIISDMQARVIVAVDVVEADSE